MVFSRCRACRGLSIVEILVALAIFSVGIYALHGQFLDLSLKSSRQILATQARLLAQQELEQLRAGDFEALAAWQPPAVVEPYLGRPNLSRKIEVQQLDSSRLEITVRVGWNAALGEALLPSNSIALTGVKAR